MRALKCLISLSLVFLLVVHPASSKASTQEPHQSVGLVLSGGGAKGIAHIGAIKALEENDIPIDYITGTSMGAIVGGLYACGYTPEEMMALLASSYFGYMSSGKIDPQFTYYFSSERPSPQMFSVQLGKKAEEKEAKRFNPQSLINPTPMVFGFMEIFSAYTSQCGRNFDNLFVPYRSVASNLTDRHSHIFRSGDLADAVRASMSFPLVFQAMKIDGDIFYDGGIYDNFPVDAMREEFDPSIMLGFDVSAASSGEPNSYMDQLDLLVMAPQTYDLPEEDGIKVRINLSDFSLLDWGAAAEIYARGYARTMEMMDSIKARVHTRTPAKTRTLRREVFKAATPSLRFSDVTVSGASPKQNEYIEYLFKPAKNTDTIGIDRARLAFYRAIASDKLNYLSPTAIPDSAGGLFKLHLETSVKSKFTAGAGAYVTSSNNSFLYLHGGYSTLSFSSVNADIEAWIGQSYMAGALSGSIYLHSAVPSAFRFTAVAQRRRYSESERLFFRDNEPTFVVNHEYFGKVCWAMAAGRRSTFEIGVGGGRLYNSFFRNNDPASYESGRDNIGQNLGQVYAGLSSSTLDNENYPTTGYSRHGVLAALAGRTHFHQAGTDSNTSDNVAWMQIDWNERHFLPVHRKWALGLEGRLVASTRKLLPSYYASISSAPTYSPTPASDNIFDPSLRANSFLAATLTPIYKYNSSLSARLSLTGFAPMRSILCLPDGTAAYSKWFDKVRFFGELDVVYALPFGSVCAYCNYASARGKFSAGISLGLYIKAPRFL